MATEGLFVTSAFTQRPRELRATLAGHPDKVLIQACIEIAAVAVFLHEGVERREQLGHCSATIATTSS
jgi:hypothetical protein